MSTGHPAADARLGIRPILRWILFEDCPNAITGISPAADSVKH